MATKRKPMAKPRQKESPCHQGDHVQKVQESQKNKTGMLTNTHCTSPYRGAGRPEASYMIERLIDIAADELDIDPTAQYHSVTGHALQDAATFTYDSGCFEENMDRATKLADWNDFAGRRKEAAERGMLRGIGLSNTIELAADPTIETAEIRFDPLGGLTLVTGSISHGQGHATIQTQILVDRLGVDPERVKFIQGDTDAVAYGMGTGGSRSTTMSGGAIALVSEKIIAKGKAARPIGCGNPFRMREHAT
jgi:carbon-monoxide dehydrogenase large subunit